MMHSFCYAGMMLHGFYLTLCLVCCLDFLQVSAFTISMGFIGLGAHFHG